MPDPVEPHPLDQPDAEAEMSVSRETSTDAVRTLSPEARRSLKIVLSVLAVSFGVVFVTAVMASNARPNSPIESIASTINRVASICLLLAFCGILLVYRLPSIRRSLAAPPRWLRSGLVNLTLSSVLAGFLLWILMVVFSRSWWFSLALAAAHCLMMALSATAAVFQRDAVRGYAIGFLTTSLATVGMAFNLALFLSMARVGRIQPGDLVWVQNVLVSFALFGGLVCAAYAHLVTRIGKPADPDSREREGSAENESRSPPVRQESF